MLHGVFTQGTTPTQVFELPFEADQLSDFTITYYQNNKEILKKYPKDCVVEDKYILVTLTQSESLSFSSHCIAEVQLKVITLDGAVLASPTYYVGVEKILDKEEI